MKQKALVVVKQLLVDFPELMGELLTLLQLVDDQQTVVLGGLEVFFFFLFFCFFLLFFLSKNN